MIIAELYLKIAWTWNQTQTPYLPQNTQKDQNYFT